MMRVERFARDKKEQWDTFVKEGKNATFLFQRDYMDYHSDRFNDYSLMVYGDEGLAAVLPANITPDNVLVSHSGLTYGGFVLRPDAGLLDTIAIVCEALRYLAGNGINTLQYKQFPKHYNVLPADELDYVLFLLRAQLYRRDTAIVRSIHGPLGFNRDRRNNIKRGKKHSLLIQEETDLGRFWNDVLIPSLKANFGAKPVHTLEEITLLKSRFPSAIRQFSVYCNGDIVAGATIYETPIVAHSQYTAALETGRQTSALSCLFDWLINDYYSGKQYFDFGACNGRDGCGLNKGLALWKESYGGRCVAHDFYTIDTRNHQMLEAASLSDGV